MSRRTFATCWKHMSQFPAIFQFRTEIFILHLNIAENIKRKTADSEHSSNKALPLVQLALPCDSLLLDPLQQYLVQPNNFCQHDATVVSWGQRATRPRSTMTCGTRLEFRAVYNLDVVCIDLGSTAGAREGGGALGAG
jgi:hypothetical protein